MSASVVMTRAELNHLLHLLGRAEEEGAYYGPPDEYWKRAARLDDKLTKAYQQLAEPRP
jgi:hypothetical protein